MINSASNTWSGEKGESKTKSYQFLPSLGLSLTLMLFLWKTTTCSKWSTWMSLSRRGFPICSTWNCIPLCKYAFHSLWNISFQNTKHPCHNFCLYKSFISPLFSNFYQGGIIFLLISTKLPLFISHGAWKIYFEWINHSRNDLL